VRPRRIARRVVARARHWGTPHVHCPGCGGDNPVPDDGALQTCFVCHVRWFRQELTGEPAVDHAAIEARVPAGARWVAVFHPLLVDVPDGDRKRNDTLDRLAFVYLP
jgi:hypothetical protein